MKTFYILIISFIYIISKEKTKKFIINRYIPYSSDDNFYPYNFTSSDFIDGGVYVFDTASFYTWKKVSSTTSTSDKNITITNKYNEGILGKIETTSDNFNWISLTTDSGNSGSIAIPINIPDLITEEIEDQLESSDSRIYNYLDLINNEINYKYINYVQESITSGYILFGEKDEIFSPSKNKRDIKSCNCSHPSDKSLNNIFLNYWNCKIFSFSVDNIKIDSLYSKSINGDIYAVFSLAEEYIIAPNKTGNEIIKYYRDLIDDEFGKECKLEVFKNNMKIMECEIFNYAELPDFTITLEGEISLNALSFDLFKNKNENFVYFKILLNELDTKEYWVIGDPIVKNYNFLFDYNKKGFENITIVASDKYDPFAITITCCITSFITALYFGFLLFARIKINIMSKNKKKHESARARRTTKKIKKIIRNQNDFEVPDENIPIPSMIKSSNTLFEIDDEELRKDDDDEKSNNENNDSEKENMISENNSSEIPSDSNSKSIKNNNDNNDNNNKSVSKTFEDEKDFENKIEQLRKKEGSSEFELKDLTYLKNLNSSDEEDCELVDEEEGSLPPLNKGIYSINNK